MLSSSSAQKGHDPIPKTQRSRLPPCNHCHHAKRKCCQTRPVCSSCASRGFTDCQYPPSKPLKRARTAKAINGKTAVGNATNTRRRFSEGVGDSRAVQEGAIITSLEGPGELRRDMNSLIQQTIPDKLPNNNSVIDNQDTTQEGATIGLTSSFVSTSPLDPSIAGPDHLSQRVVSTSPNTLLWVSYDHLQNDPDF